MSSQTTRSISFTDTVFPTLEAARKRENRDRSNYINHVLKEHFIAIGWMTPDGKPLPKVQRTALAKAS